MLEGDSTALPQSVGSGAKTQPFYSFCIPIKHKVQNFIDIHDYVPATCILMLETVNVNIALMLY